MNGGGAEGSSEERLLVHIARHSYTTDERTWCDENAHIRSAACGAAACVVGVCCFSDFP